MIIASSLFHQFLMRASFDKKSRKNLPAMPNRLFSRRYLFLVSLKHRVPFVDKLGRKRPFSLLNPADKLMDVVF